MKAILPREFLWTDKETMDEFFELDRVNEDFFEVFVTLREEPFAVTSNEVKVFNEVYYQLTRMVYERPLPSDLDKYVADVKANLGWNYSAELVMSMVYFLLALIDKHVRPLNKFFTKAINERFFGCLYWKPFKHRFECLKKAHRKINYHFKPSPVDVWYIQDKYVDWKTITHGYDLGCLDDVINLWHDMEDKKEVAWIINETSHILTLPSTEYNRILRFLNIYMLSDSSSFDDKCGEPPTDDCQSLKVRINEMNSEKAVLQSRIKELEAENEKLKALQENKKSNGKARRFTLVEIVDYCKGRVEWDDVKDIVAMLNRLLRKTGTEEDSDLVDSIEKEFKKRKYGDSVIGNKTSYGDNSSMVNLFLSGNVDYEQFFAALPDDIKDIWRKQLNKKDNG